MHPLDICRGAIIRPAGGGVINGKPVKLSPKSQGEPDSKTETYVAMQLASRLGPRSLFCAPGVT